MKYLPGRDYPIAFEKVQTLAERFWIKVDIHLDSNKCWEWLASTNGDGYGHFNYDGSMKGAHQVAWFLTYGIWPELCVLHSCDNPPCCNVNHLRLGTKADNARDRAMRGRCAVVKGINNPRAKLTEDQVREIRRLHLIEGVSQPTIGKMFDIGNGHVGSIVYNKIWKGIV